KSCGLLALLKGRPGSLTTTRLHQSGQRRCAKAAEQDRRQDRVESGCADQASQHHYGYWMKNFLSCCFCSDQKRKKRKACGRSGHHHRCNTLEAASLDECIAVGHILDQNQIEIMTDLKNAVAHTDAGNGNETDDASERQR